MSACDNCSRDVEFHWDPAHEMCLQNIKDSLSRAPVLGYFNVNEKIEVQVDSSKDGVGCVLIQKGKPITYASCALTETQKRYAQIEKECFAVVTACRKFHQYLYNAKDIIIYTDHKPLELIFQRGLSQVPTRLVRMLL